MFVPRVRQRVFLPLVTKLLLAVPGALSYSQSVNVTVTLNAETFTVGTPVEATVNVNSMGATVNNTADCTVTPGGTSIIVELSGSGMEAEGETSINTISFSPEAYTITCTGSATIKTPYNSYTETGSGSATFVVNSSQGSCSGEEGEPTSRNEINGSLIVNTTFTLPYGLSDGTSSSLSTTGIGVTDDTGEQDCDGYEILEDGNGSFATITDGPANSNSDNTVTFHWNINDYSYGIGTPCDCTGECNCNTNGVEEDSIQPVASPRVFASEPLSCK